MNFNTPQFTKIIEKALAQSAHSKRWQKAIERAAEGLKSGSIMVAEEASGAIVTTENGSYRIYGGKCECPAYQNNHQPCKHRAARRLCALYSEVRIGEEITRSREWDYSGASYEVTRVGGWVV